MRLRQITTEDPKGTGSLPISPKSLGGDAPKAKYRINGPFADGSFKYRGKTFPNQAALSTFIQNRSDLLKKQGAKKLAERMGKRGIWSALGSSLAWYISILNAFGQTARYMSGTVDRTEFWSSITTAGIMSTRAGYVSFKALLLNAKPAASALAKARAGIKGAVKGAKAFKWATWIKNGLKLGSAGLAAAWAAGPGAWLAFGITAIGWILTEILVYIGVSAVVSLFFDWWLNDIDTELEEMIKNGETTEIDEMIKLEMLLQAIEDGKWAPDTADELGIKSRDDVADPSANRINKSTVPYQRGQDSAFSVGAESVQEITNAFEWGKLYLNEDDEFTFDDNGDVVMLAEQEKSVQKDVSVNTKGFLQHLNKKAGSKAVAQALKQSKVSNKADAFKKIVGDARQDSKDKKEA